MQLTDKPTRMKTRWALQKKLSLILKGTILFNSKAKTRIQYRYSCYSSVPNLPSGPEPSRLSHILNPTAASDLF